MTFDPSSCQILPGPDFFLFTNDTLMHRYVIKSEFNSFYEASSLINVKFFVCLEVSRPPLPLSLSRRLLRVLLASCAPSTKVMFHSRGVDSFCRVDVFLVKSYWVTKVMLSNTSRKRIIFIGHNKHGVTEQYPSRRRKFFLMSNKMGRRRVFNLR